MLLSRRHNGMSLLEIILASIIAVLGVAGFFAVLGSVRQPVKDNDKTLKAAQIGKEYLENLRAQISAETYTGLPPAGAPLGYKDPLDIGSHTDRVGIYTISYVVSLSIPGDSLSPKRVEMKVSWD